MTEKGKNILKYIFWGVVAVVLVWFCMRAVDWNEFAKALQVCKWEYMLIALACGGLFVFFHSLRWGMLLRAIDPSVRRIDVFSSYGMGYLANLVLPRVGEVVKMGYVIRNSKLSWDATIGTFMVERGFDALVSAGLVIYFFAGNWSAIENIVSFGGTKYTLVWILLALVLLALVFCFLCYKFRDKGGIWTRMWGFIVGIGRGLTSLFHMKRPWLFFIYTVLIWSCHFFASAAVIWALNDIEPFTVLHTPDAFNLMIAGTLSTVIPVPGGFGAYHGAVASVLQALHGIPMGSGMIYATLNHESQVLAQIMVGAWSYIHEALLHRK